MIQASLASIPPVATDFRSRARLVLNVPLLVLNMGFVSTPPRDDATSSKVAATTTATEAHHKRFDRFCASTA